MIISIEHDFIILWTNL